jgi:hypothetical protein
MVLLASILQNRDPASHGGDSEIAKVPRVRGVGHSVRGPQLDSGGYASRRFTLDGDDRAGSSVLRNRYTKWGAGMIAFDARNRIHGGAKHMSASRAALSRKSPGMLGAFPRLAFISSRWVQVAGDSWADGGRSFIASKRPSNTHTDETAN